MFRAMRIAWTAALVVLAACGGTPRPVPARPAAPPAGASHPAAPPPVKLTARAQLDWVLAVIVQRHGAVDRAELEAHFAPPFLAQVPPDQAAAVFAGLAKQLPGLAITQVGGDDDRLVAHATSGDTKLRIALAVDPATRKIVGLLFQPDTQLGPKPTSLALADQALGQLAPKADLVVVALDGGTCTPRHELVGKQELAIGSTFKLYVLLAVADQIAAGKLAWDTEIAVRDDWKSLPSGVTQDAAAGTRLTVRELATRMISISDNTAADHLLYTVGRRAVEHAVVEAGHAQPALDTPFFSTRELFLFKLALPPAEVDRYLKLPAAARRAYLDKQLAGKVPALGQVDQWKGARRIDRLEWFASGEDLCRVMAVLWKRAQDPQLAPLLDVLAKNPGLPIDKQVFPYIGFKGGSEPGVLNLTYLLRRDDGKWFVVTLGANAAEGGSIDEDKFFGIALGVIDLVGKDRAKP